MDYAPEISGITPVAISFQSQMDSVSPPIKNVAVSPLIKHFTSVPPNKFQVENDKSEEEGLIEGESEEEKKKP